jgi:hypothetical protein
VNYAQARSLADKSGWHYTVQNDGRVWTHSCCRTQVPATAEQVAELEWIYHGSLKVGDLIDGPPHAPHATKEEAEECYHQWRLRRVAESIEFADDVFGEWQGCRAVEGAPDFEGDEPGREVTLSYCDAPSKGGARYRDDHHPEVLALCERHREAKHVLARIGRVTSSAYS